MPRHVVTLRRWQVGVAFAAVTVAFVVQGVLLKLQIDRTETALLALCAQRDDLDQRIVVTTALLQTHHAKFVFGIPRKLILSGLHRDLGTRQNLEILDCKEAT